MQISQQGFPNRPWFERMAQAEENGDCTVISPGFRALMEATGPYTVHVAGTTELVTSDARYEEFSAAVFHANSLANWNRKAVVRDEPTGRIIHVVQPYNQDMWEAYQKEHGLKDEE